MYKTIIVSITALVACFISVLPVQAKEFIIERRIEVRSSHTTLGSYKGKLEQIRERSSKKKSHLFVPDATQRKLTIGPTSYIEERIQAIFGEVAPVALAIARCESGLRYDAFSHTNDYGVFQINRVHLPKFNGANPFDVDANIRVAKQIYDSSGFYPWVTYKNGCYKNFL